MMTVRPFAVGTCFAFPLLSRTLESSLAPADPLEEGIRKV